MNLGTVASLLVPISIKNILIGTINFRISFTLTEIYSIYRCRWNVATYKCKNVHNAKI